MPQTTAQRQQAYRAKRPFAGDNGKRRLSLWMTAAAGLALKRLAKNSHTSQRDILERLILNADNEIIQVLRGNDEGFEKYIDG